MKTKGITKGTGKSELVIIRIKKKDLETFKEDATEKKLPMATYIRLLIYKGFNATKKQTAENII